MARKKIPKKKLRPPLASKPHRGIEEEKTYVVGRLHLHVKGFGFVECDDRISHPQDIFIPRHLVGNAVDGDRVEVLVRGEPISEKGPEGRIVTILERSRTHLAGVITASLRNGTFSAYAPLLGRERNIVVASHPDLKVGDRVIMVVDTWGERADPTHASVTHMIGHISDASCDTAAAIEEYEIRDAFPHPVIEEAKTFGTKVLPKECLGREDLRDLVCFTIDPTTARDYDDALSLAQDKKGNFHLAVHIADVSHYVQRNSALDIEASTRCNSTYFPGRCVPMLPPELSNELCSLKPRVTRLSVTVFIEYSPQGELLNYRIARSVIRSRKRFTYEEAKQVLDGDRKSPYAPTLRLMESLCLLLKKRRFARGSIEFALPELVVLCDEKGSPTGTQVVSYDITHQMVEEFMLQANEIIARNLSEAGKNVAYRVHEEPAEENLRDFATLAAAFGYRLSDKPTIQELQELFRKAEQTAHAPQLATNYIRKMRLAVYSPDNIGHYGLSLTHYCHFTSPIRRYIDLVIHRILFGDEHEWEHIEEISRRCSEQERISAKAEGSVLLLKKLRLLEMMKKKEPRKEWQGVITKVKKFGLYFEMIDLLLEGFIPISELEEDYFIVDEAKMRMEGKNTGIRYQVGQTVSVFLKEIDFLRLEHQWYLIPTKKSKRRPNRPTKKRKR